MSMPTIPDSFGDLTQEQSCNMMMASIAMSELALSHIINAEAEKIQYILGTLPDKPCECPTTEEILQVNHSVSNVLDKVMNNLLLLKGTLSMALECQGRSCASNPGVCPSPCPQPCPRPEPQPCPKPEPQPCPRPQPQPRPESEPQSCPQPKPQPCPNPEPQPCPRPEAQFCLRPCPQSCPNPCPRPDPLPCCDHVGINIYYAIQDSPRLQWRCDICPNRHIFQKGEFPGRIYLSPKHNYLISYTFHLCVGEAGAVSISLSTVRDNNCCEIHTAGGYTDDWDSEICISGSAVFTAEQHQPSPVFFSVRAPYNTVIDQAKVSIAELH